MKWSENETCHFVNLYLKHEHLYNPGLPDYRAKPKRKKAYNDIIADFHTATGILLNETELRTKIKSLRSTYSQEITKIRQRSSPDSVFMSSIKWFSAWHKCFAGKFKNTANLDTSALDNEEPENDLCQKVWVGTDLEQTNSNENINEDPFNTEQDNFILVLKPEPDTSGVKQETAQSSYKMRKRKLKHSSIDNTSSYRHSVDVDSGSEFVPKEDEFDIYGKYIASQLRKMNLQKALRLQLEIQSLVSEARISDVLAE